MKVYKLYLKLVLNKLPVVIVSIGIFLTLMLVFLNSGGNQIGGFSETKCKIAFFNEDSESELINGYEESLKKYANFQDVKKNEIDDALFFHMVTLVIIVPKDFEKDLKEGKEISIDVKGSENNISAITVLQATNDYFKYYETYHKNFPSLSESELVKKVKDTLELTIDVHYQTEEDKKIGNANSYFNYLSYLLLGLVMTTIALIVTSLKDLDVNRRMNVSPYGSFKTNFEIILGHFSFALFVALLLSAIYCFMNKAMLSIPGLLLILNTILFLIPVVGLAYLVTSLVKSRGAIDGITNVLSLGQAFLCGAFIPQEYLSNGVLGVAHCFPTYYFVRANNIICSLNSFSFANMKEAYLMMLLETLFGIGLFVLGFLINKRKQKSEA